MWILKKKMALIHPHSLCLPSLLHDLQLPQTKDSINSHISWIWSSLMTCLGQRSRKKEDFLRDLALFHLLSIGRLSQLHMNKPRLACQMPRDVRQSSVLT